MDNLKNEICEAFNTSLDTVVKQSYRGGPRFTVSDVLDRVLDNTFISLDKAFPEIGARSTIVIMLQKVFKSKTLKAQPWNVFLLASIGRRRCSTCRVVKVLDSFYTVGYSCKECESIRHKTSYINNPEAILARNKEWKLNNPDKVVKQAREYYQSHQAESKARNIKRTLSLELATPKWADLAKMNLIYNNREEGEHIDHIIPLQHPLVCGLHNEFNLQYLLAADNISKGNKFDVETYVHELP